MKLSIPLLVQELKLEGSGKPAFVVRPLFFDTPVEANEDLGRAVGKLAGTLRKTLDGAGREPRHDQSLADWTFNPDLREHTVNAEVGLRRPECEVPLLVVTLESLGRTLAFVPVVPGLWFEVTRGSTVNERARDVLHEYLREQEHDEQEPSEYEIPITLTRAARAWLSNVDLDVHPKHKLDEDDSITKLLSLGGGEKADGREELIKVGRCLDWLYPNDLDRAILRDVEVSELMRLLDARDRRPVLLVGPPSVGKTAIVNECVYRRVHARGSPHVTKQNVWLLAPQRLISGMMYVGQWEDRLLAILEEARKRDHVLYFDDLLGLYQAGVSSASDLNVAHVMRSHVERQSFRVLGEIAPTALRVLREQDRGFADLFHVIPINPTPETQTRRILVDSIRRLETRHRCEFQLDALPAVMDLQHRYVRELAEPGKSAGFVRELATRHEGAKVDRRDVLEAFHRRSGLAVTFLDTSARLERADVVAGLTSQLIGQNTAVEAMADVVGVAKARVNDPHRPLATMLFLGPTGVGKTQAAKALARYLFGEGTEQRLVRIDMNEYVEPGSASRLVGTFRQPEGLLTSRVRRQPFCVLLLDEIEKADPSVFDLLLQVLGEGRLTDALGRAADFTNCIVVMTSNLGVREAGNTFGLRPGDEDAAASRNRAVFVSAAERFFRPEFFNRIDRIIPFESLTRDHVGLIAEILIADVFKREGLVHRRCALRVEPDAMQRIIRDGYHPQLGARALKRSIERALTRPVAARLAAMAHDSPAVITIYTEAGGELSAKVDPLVHAEPLAPQPVAFDPRDPDDALDRVDDAVTRIEHAMESLQPEPELRQGNLSAAHFRYLALREHARHLRRQIDRIDRLLEQSRRPVRRSGVRNPAPPVRKRKVIIRRDFAGISLWKDVISAEDVHARMADLAESASEPVEEIEASLSELAQDAALLRAQSASDARDRCLIVARPVNNVSGGHAGVLAQLYAKTFDEKFHHFTARAIVSEPQLSILEVEMPAGHSIFAGETGTHLFLPSAGGTLPVQVFVQPLEVEQDAHDAMKRLLDSLKKFQLDPVVRIYDELRATADLRSGAVTRGLPTPLELRRMILASLPPAEEILS